MADDPERDLLPVKEGAPYERKVISSCSMNCDRDVYAPYISKLDRKALEDRYMSLLLDNNRLKKESCRQEEKIKRLATKLLRLIAEQKHDIPTAQRRDYEMENVIMEQQQQLRELQQSNCNLQSKITVLKKQLAEHSTMHSASHCSNKPRSTSRSPARRGCASNSRIRASCSSNGSPNLFQAQSTSLCLKGKQPSNPKGISSCDCHTKKQQRQIVTDVRIDCAELQQNEQLSQEVMRLNEEIRILEQEMVTQREQSRVRIRELEESLAQFMANDKRQKVAENVEMIRLQRNLQQQTAQMAANNAKIQFLEREVEQLQQELEASQQDNDELQCLLCKERQKIVDIQESLQGAESDRLSIREHEEKIRDLQNEKAELKDHNERLLTLMSSKQKQCTEQEGALRTQVCKLESMLSHQNCECARLKQELEKAKHMTAKNLLSQGKDKDLQSPVKQLESDLAAERKEKSNLMQLLNDMQALVSKLKDKDVEKAAEVENQLRSKVTILEKKLAVTLNEQKKTNRNLEEEKAKVEALKRTQTDLLNKLAQQTETEKQQDADKFCVCPEPRIPSLEESRSAHAVQKPSSVTDVAISSKISDDIKQSLEFGDSTENTSEDTSDKGLDSGSKSEDTLLFEESEENILEKSEESLPGKSEKNDRRLSQRSEKSSLADISEKSEENMSRRSKKSIASKSTSEKDGSEDIDDSLRIDSEEITSMAAVPGDSKNKDCLSETADRIDICRELEKCRELLRVQYNLNSLYKKEVANLALRLNEKQIEKSKKEEEKSEHQEKESDESSSLSYLVPSGTEEYPGRLTVKHGEGVFEIHIQSIELFPESFQNLTCKSSPSDVPSLFLTWIFYNQDMAYTSVKKVECDIEFDSSSVYRVTLNEEFLNYLAEGECTVEVHMTVDDASKPVGRGKISFSELLEFPQNKIHTSVSVSGINKQASTAFFGVIQCWYRISCSVRIISDFARRRHQADLQKNETNIDSRKLTNQSNSISEGIINSHSSVYLGKSKTFRNLMTNYEGMAIDKDDESSSSLSSNTGKESTVHLVGPPGIYNDSTIEVTKNGKKDNSIGNGTHAVGKVKILNFKRIEKFIL